MKRQDMPKLYYTHTDALKDWEVFDAFFERMPDHRKRKVEKIRPEEEKRRSLAAGILLVRGFRDLGLDPYLLDLAEGPKGKPYLRSKAGNGEEHIFFNLSHSGNLAIALFSGIQSGCDAERIRQQPKEQLEKLSNRFFSEEEKTFLARIGSGHPERYPAEFTRIWTLKESYIKAVGEGLSIPLDSFSVLGKDESLHNVDFKEPELDPGYKTSCCFLEGSKDPEIIGVDITQAIETI